MPVTITCLVCHEFVRVPVRFVCFPCPEKTGEESCNDRIRVCLLCARSYLDLHRPRHERVETRKCLVCPATAEPRRLTATTAYKKDFLLMSMDDGVYPCFHDHEGCAFEGQQQELDRHIREGCEYRRVFCTEPFCRRTFVAHGLEEHKKTCPGYTTCRDCRAFLRKAEEHDHMRAVHRLRKCRHCRSWKEDAHEARCPERPVPCPLCVTVVLVPPEDFRRHLCNHAKGYTRVLEEKKLRVAVLQEEIVRFERLLEKTTGMLAGYESS